MQIEPGDIFHTPLPALATWKRRGLLVAGWVAIGLAVLGVILPGLPATPFVLLAAACFTRSSPRALRWLLEHKHLGPPLQDWLRDRRLPRKIRYFALASMASAIALSIWLLGAPGWALVVLPLAGLVGAWSVLRIPVR